MKKLTCIIMLLLFGPVAFTQQKVVDKSGRKPDWVNGVEKDFIIVSGSGATINDAQNSALMIIKERIVSSVADNVKATSTMQTEETNTNKSVHSFFEKYTSQVTSQSGKVPYLQGISLSNANEFYWEKLSEKKINRVYYEYHIKYPFPEFELKKLVSDFRFRDKELTDNLNRIEEEVETVTSIEQIESNLDELKALQDAFIDARLDKVNTVSARYRGLFKAVELTEIENSLGLLKFTLRLNDRIISTVKKPTVTSECARINGTKNNVTDWEISYNYDNCYEDPENNIAISFRFGNVAVSKKFYFDVAANKASIFVSEAIQFVKVTDDAENILSSDCIITAVSKYDSPVIIQKVTLEIKGTAPIILEDINQSFSGKGNHALKLSVSNTMAKQITTSAGKSNPVLSGSIQYKNQATGENLTYRIYNQKYSTSW
ncbi:MAG: hypothetical protein WCS03_08905 [Bacteroidota bacterium]